MKRRISSTSQCRIIHRSLIVRVEISLLFLSRLIVPLEILCFLVRVYQFSLDFSKVSQNGV
nr:MAG TPA: hypothetical protein [Caudoviricetes sp.]